MSDLESAFGRLWQMLDGPALEREHRFAAPRRYRFDFAHLEARVAIEVEGGVWNRGRHVRPGGFEADVAKYNIAASLGWMVFRVTARMLDHDPVGTLTPMMETIAERLREVDGAPPDTAASDSATLGAAPGDSTTQGTATGTEIPDDASAG